VLAVSGPRMYAYKVDREPRQIQRAEGGVWTAQEIHEHWSAIVKA